MQILTSSIDFTNTGNKETNHAIISQYEPHFLLVRDKFQSQILKRDVRKNDCLIELKEFMPQIFAWEEAYCVSFQKRLCKMKYGAEGSISNVDLDLFWSNTGFEI